MQLLFSSSTEDGYCEGLNIIEVKGRKIYKKESGLLKIPHVGFNQISIKKKIKLFENIKN